LLLVNETTSRWIEKKINNQKTTQKKFYKPTKKWWETIFIDFNFHDFNKQLG
jgi:hypothetical protein